MHFNGARIETDLMRPEIVALGILFVGILIGMAFWQSARTKKARANILNGVLPLFDTYRVTQEGSDFARLDGKYRGYRFKLELIPDMIGLRKLPSLWLLVTLQEKLPWRGSLDLLMRPQNIEFWSPSSQLGHRMTLPKHWPQHMAVNTNRPEEIPAMERLDPYIAIFDDPRMKELLIAPGGVRLVWQADQGRSAHYMVLRQAEWERTQIEPDKVRALLEKTLAIHRDLLVAAREDGVTMPEEADVAAR